MTAYVPSPGDRVRVVAVSPRDIDPAHRVGQVFTAGIGCEAADQWAGPGFAYVSEGDFYAPGTWAIVERVADAGAPDAGAQAVDACENIPFRALSEDYARMIDILTNPHRLPDADPPANPSVAAGVRTSAVRKAQPIATGVLAYFPLTMAAVAAHSKRGNDKHNPGEPLHWAREKSTDEADCIARHLVDTLAEGPLAQGTLDDGTPDGCPHVVALAWRALALCERVLSGDDRWRGVARK